MPKRPSCSGMHGARAAVRLAETLAEVVARPPALEKHTDVHWRVAIRRGVFPPAIGSSVAVAHQGFRQIRKAIYKGAQFCSH